MKAVLKLIGLYLNALGLLLPRTAGKQAFLLFCTPFAAKIKPHQAKFLDTAERSTMRFEDKEIQLYAWGTGEKLILCVHGWQSNSYRWKRLVETSDLEEYSIIALDAPAHGRSEGRILNVPIYARLLQQVFSELGPVHTLMTHSIGGFASMHMMHENPVVRPDQSVMLAAPGNAEDFIGYFKNMIRLSSRTERLMREYFHRHIGEEVAYFDTQFYGPTLDIPGLIIHDRGDVEVPIIHAENLHASWPASQLIVTDGLGHKLKGEEVLGRLWEFINRAEDAEKQPGHPKHSERIVS